MANGPDTDDKRSAEGAELASTIPFYEETSLPFDQMAKLKVREDGFSDLPELADSFIVVLDNKAGVYTFIRAAIADAPGVGEVKEISELQLSALKIRQNGFSDRPDLQGSHFEVAKNDDGTYVVSRTSILTRAIECTAASTKAAETHAESAKSIPFNQLVSLSRDEVTMLKLDNIGCSKLPEFSDSIFVGIRQGREGCSLYRIALDNVPAVGETRRMTAAEVSALRILPNGQSDRPDLQNSRFTWKSHGDFTFTVSRLPK